MCFCIIYFPPFDIYIAVCDVHAALFYILSGDDLIAMRWLEICLLDHGMLSIRRLMIRMKRTWNMMWCCESLDDTTKTR